MKSRVQLSISILMSGRKETRVCLESLKKLMDEVTCELIIVDTGCDRDTIDIIKEYTDIIIPFTWCNDFAKARNEGLKRATGQWFMFMDDDEWFEDTTEIIEFFKGNEHNKYNCASYVVRNYMDYDGKKYVDANITRMSKLTEETYFKGKVHEYLDGIYRPVKIFSSYVHHYGYVYKDDKEHKAHVKRNVSILEELMLEKKDIHYVAQALAEYLSLGEYRKAIDVAKETIYDLEEYTKEYRKKSIHIGSVYGFLAKAYMFLYEYDEVIKYTDKAINDDVVSDLACAYMYKCRVCAFNELEKYEESLEAYEKYMQAYDILGDDKEVKLFQGGLLIEGTFSEKEMQEATICAFRSAIMLNKISFIEKYMDVLNDKYNIEYREIFLYLQKIEEKINKLKENVVNNEKTIESDIIDENRKEYIKYNEIFTNSIKTFSKLDNVDDWYVVYLKILQKSIYSDGKELFDLFNILFDKVVDIFSLDNKLWEIVDKYNIDMKELIDNKPYDKWKAGVDHWSNYAKEDELNYVEQLINTWNISDSIRFDYLQMKIKDMKMLEIGSKKEKNAYEKSVEGEECEEKEIEFEEYENCILSYIEKTIYYYKQIYREELFVNSQELLPIDCRFALQMDKIIKLRKEDGKKALVYIKEIVDKCEYYTDVINTYSKLLGEYIIDEKNKANKAKQEMLDLAIILKIKAREYLENGNVEQAKVILNNVLQNIPTDKEAKEILSMIED